MSVFSNTQLKTNKSQTIKRIYIILKSLAKVKCALSYFNIRSFFRNLTTNKEKFLLFSKMTFKDHVYDLVNEIYFRTLIRQKKHLI